MSVIILRSLCRKNVNFKLNFSSVLKVRETPKIFIRRFETKNPADKPSLLKRITKKLFGRYLLTTNTVGSGILMVVGDVLAQEIDYQRGLTKERCNIQRIGQMFIVGALLGPLHHYFYRWMDAAMPMVSMKTVFQKITLDQVVMAPLCLVIFFYSAGFLEGKSISASGDEFRSKFWTIYMVDWLIWPIAQFCNFYYLHPKYRVLYVNVVTAMYNVFLSYIKHIENFGKDEETFLHSDVNRSDRDAVLEVTSVK